MDNGALYECHGHIMMDGADFAAARARHAEGIDEEAVRQSLRALREAGVTYFRDGGDALGVSLLGRALAPESGITYVTPVFALHKKGLYGGIVGRSFTTEESFRQRIREMREAGGDFVKLMVSGIVTFRRYGELSCPGLPGEEIGRLIAIAHEEGYPVMIHGNGDEAVRAAAEAGADSIEHGVFLEEDTLRVLSDRGTFWVPTVAAIEAFSGREGCITAGETSRRHLEAIARGHALGVRIACGSDSGAVGVPHGEGTLREMELLGRAGISTREILATGRELSLRFGPAR